ncbi:MAG: dihydrofolate reductase family protein [Oscillospiraceae bacterium]
MREVVLYISSSIDGYIADKNGDVNWIKGQSEDFIVPDRYSDFIQDIDTVILGYSTYKQIVEELSVGDWPYKGLQTYVFTSKEIKSDDPSIIFINDEIKTFINEIKNKEGKDIWVCGGSEVLNSIMKQDNSLIDVYHIVYAPILLGDGIKLFQKGFGSVLLKLDYLENYNGFIECRYKLR